MRIQTEWCKRWLANLTPDARASFLEHQEQEELIISITRAIEWEINKLRHYFYAKVNLNYGNAILEIYIRHTDERTMIIIDLLITEGLRIRHGNSYRQISLSDPNSLNMKAILDSLYDEHGPKGTCLAGLLEKALKLPTK